ncbi:MAG: hypothetical protein OZ929_22315, partial [Bryobacterales bacterium]|nr:hypothetical protein [Bryobacterales bacterium]
DTRPLDSGRWTREPQKHNQKKNPVRHAASAASISRHSLPAMEWQQILIEDLAYGGGGGLLAVWKMTWRYFVPVETAGVDGVSDLLTPSLVFESDFESDFESVLVVFSFEFPFPRA